MSNLISLLKVAFYNTTGINGLTKNIKDKKEKSKLTFTTLTYLFIGVCIIAMVSAYSYVIAEVLKPMGQLNLLLVISVIITSIVIIITYVYKAPSILFSSKDYDLLMSLPIKNSIILSSKLIEMMIINYVFTALIMVPVSVVYFITSGNLQCTFFLTMLIAIIFIPMIPVVVASILAVVIYYISSRFKNKNIISIILGLITMILVLYGSIKLQDIINYFVANSTSIVEGFEKVYKPAKYIVDAMINFNILSLIKFISVSVVPFLLFIVIFSATFTNINKVLGESYRKSNYKMKELKTSTIITALTKEEFKRYFSIKIYVMNTFVGMILVLGAALVSLFKGEEFITVILEIPNISNMIAAGTLAIIIFGIGLSCTTACSISIEGKNLWIKKTLPISPIDIFKSKILTNLILSIPIAILSNIIFYIALKFDFIYLLINIVITIAFALLSAIVGLIINLYFPKLQWSNPTAVVKQSTSVFINMIFTFVSIILPIVILVLFGIDNLKLGLSIITIIISAITFVAWNILKSKGVRQFNIL